MAPALRRAVTTNGGGTSGPPCPLRATSRGMFWGSMGRHGHSRELPRFISRATNYLGLGNDFSRCLGRVRSSIVVSGAIRQTACKPGSVRPVTRRDGHSSATRLATRLARPTRAAGRECPRVHVRGCPRTRRRPPLFGLAPGGVCPAAAVAGNAVRSCRTISPLPAGRFAWRGRYIFCGTFPGVAPAGR